MAGRPVANLSFAIDHWLAPGSVRGYHVTNVLIHLVAGLLLLGVVRRTLDSDRIRAQAGLDAAWPAAAMAATVGIGAASLSRASRAMLTLICNSSTVAPCIELCAVVV